jgi:hypothetical protein
LIRRRQRRADGLNAGFGNVDTSQQMFLTTPQHA